MEGEVTIMFQMHLHFTTKESVVLILEDVQHFDSPIDMSLCMLVQVLTLRYFNKKAFVDMMNSLWSISYPLQFRDLVDNTFICHFLLFEDKKWVQLGAPWHFDRALVLLDDVKGHIVQRNISINRALFWFRFITFLCWVCLNL